MSQDGKPVNRPNWPLACQKIKRESGTAGSWFGADFKIAGKHAAAGMEESGRRNTEMKVDHRKQGKVWVSHGSPGRKQLDNKQRGTRAETAEDGISAQPPPTRGSQEGHHTGGGVVGAKGG